MPALIRALAHEYAHQWGAADLNNGAPNDALMLGDYARDQYLADNGAKCGGLMP
jgi:hypothetical protein